MIIKIKVMTDKEAFIFCILCHYGDVAVTWQMN